LPKPLAANYLAIAKIIPDSDDPCDHYYRGLSYDDEALIDAFVNCSLGPLARPLIGRVETVDQACPSNRQDHLPDQNDLYAHDA
jgi:hypothetical protein